LPTEKPNNTIGRPIAIPFKKIFNGILYVLRTGCQWKMLLPKEYGSGSTCIVDFSNGMIQTSSKRYSLDY
jgi:transposase